MSLLTVGVVGASGYSGALATRLLAQHPHFELAFCSSDKHAGADVGATLGIALRRSIRFVENSQAEAASAGCDAALLATPAEVSASLAPRLLERGMAVIDLSGAFRLGRADAYPLWYHFEHPSPSWLGRAHYGLPELYGAPPERRGLVANPGCYPTATLLALGPLLKAGVIEPSGLVVDAKSGVTGAGRQAKEEYSLAELGDNFRAYRLLDHQHTPEIRDGLSRLAKAGAAPVGLTFVPHLLPIKRGLFATCYARPAASLSSRAAEECVRDFYAGSDFVDVVPPSEVDFRTVVGTNRARVGVTATSDVVLVVCTIDNLVKGAAGQAVQNLNLMFGFEPASGLQFLHRSAP